MKRLFAGVLTITLIAIGLNIVACSDRARPVLEQAGPPKDNPVILDPAVDPNENNQNDDDSGEGDDGEAKITCYVLSGDFSVPAAAATGSKREAPGLLLGTYEYLNYDINQMMKKPDHSTKIIKESVYRRQLIIDDTPDYHNNLETLPISKTTVDFSLNTELSNDAMDELICKITLIDDIKARYSATEILYDESEAILYVDPEEGDYTMEDIEIESADDDYDCQTIGEKTCFILSNPAGSE